MTKGMGPVFLIVGAAIIAAIIGIYNSIPYREINWPVDCKSNCEPPFDDVDDITTGSLSWRGK
jgi:hypothetical protein